MEYTTRDLACRISGGNPSDTMSYNYEWMYRPTYRVSDKDIPLPYGMCLTSLVVIYLGVMYMVMDMIINTVHGLLVYQHFNQCHYLNSLKNAIII